MGFFHNIYSTYQIHRLHLLNLSLSLSLRVPPASDRLHGGAGWWAAGAHLCPWRDCVCPGCRVSQETRASEDVGLRHATGEWEAASCQVCRDCQSASTSVDALAQTPPHTSYVFNLKTETRGACFDNIHGQERSDTGTIQLLHLSSSPLVLHRKLCWIHLP